MRYSYPYDVRPEPEGGFFISFPDVPEALTNAGLDEDVAPMAQDALVSALSFYTDEARPLPTASSGAGRSMASVPVLVALKLALHDALLSQGMTNVALAIRLGTDEKAVRRLRDPLHGSKVESLEAALAALGCRAEVTVRHRAA